MAVNAEESEIAPLKITRVYANILWNEHDHDCPEKQARYNITTTFHDSEVHS